MSANGYIFCIWIWIMSLFYYFDIISFSPLYLSIGALLFTIPFHIYYKKDSLLWSLFVITLETGILLLNFHKHMLIDKKSFFVSRDMEISVIIFGCYLLFLRLMNKSFYKVYFIDLLK